MERERQFTRLVERGVFPVDLQDSYIREVDQRGLPEFERRMLQDERRSLDREREQQTKDGFYIV